MRILYSHRIQSRDGQSVHVEELIAALREPGARGAGGRARLLRPGATSAAKAAGARVPRPLPRAVGGAGGARLQHPRPGGGCALPCRRFRPDLIYERYNLYYLAGTWLARRTGIPLFLEVNAPLADERTRLRRAGAAATRPSAGALRLAVGGPGAGGDRRAEAIIAAAGVPGDRIEVVPNGIDPAASPPCRQREAAPDQVVLGFVGFVRDWHGLDAVIAPWQRTVRPEVRAGRGGGRSRPPGSGAGRRRRWGWASGCTFTGLQPREAIPALVAGFDIALQPRVVAYASPLKLFEYMAAGGRSWRPTSRTSARYCATGRPRCCSILPQRARCGTRSAGWPAMRLCGGASGRPRRAEIARRDYTWRGECRADRGMGEGTILPCAGGLILLYIPMTPLPAPRRHCQFHGAIASPTAPLPVPRRHCQSHGVIAGPYGVIPSPSNSGCSSAWYGFQRPTELR